jgi:osmotically-inducible protein OsmY
MDHINRFGEIHPRPARGQAPYIPLVEDEYGMTREEDESLDPDWSHDPRSESAHEKHVEEVKAFTPDAKIKDQVELALYLSPEVNSDEITIKVEAGVVSLKGNVVNRKQKIAAERCIEQIPAVEDILNYLEIRL